MIGAANTSCNCGLGSLGLGGVSGHGDGPTVFSLEAKQDMVTVANHYQLADAITESQNAFFNALPQASKDAERQMDDILKTVNAYNDDDNKQKLLTNITPQLFSPDAFYQRLYQILDKAGVHIDSVYAIEVETSDAEGAVNDANKAVTNAQAAAAEAQAAAEAAKGNPTSEALALAERLRIEAENAKALAEKKAREAQAQVDATNALLAGDKAKYAEQKEELEKLQKEEVRTQYVPPIVTPLLKKDSTPWGMIAGGAFVLWLLSSLSKDKR